MESPFWVHSVFTTCEHMHSVLSLWLLWFLGLFLGEPVLGKQNCALQDSLHGKELVVVPRDIRW